MTSVLHGVVFLGVGFLVAAIVGMFAHWFDRKITARVQWRVGPPFFQPWYDFLKLLIKEVVVPEGAQKFTFLAAPVISLASVSVVAALLIRTIVFPAETFVGDLIVVIYLMTIPSQALILGAFSSGNPLASLGGSREMKLILSYELPFLLAVLVPVVKAGNTIRLGEILQFQGTEGAAIASISGVISFVVALLCMQAKLAKVPFDAPEAETEIMAGAYIEYSGAALGLFKLSQWMMMFVVPLFLMMMWVGAVNWQQTWLNLFFAVLIYIGILLFMTLIRNTNVRLRIDQIMKFFWARVTPIAVIALILAFLGL
jgi:NADH-quinone oxidoreductase subunit H